jgi:hypothetical protein
MRGEPRFQFGVDAGLLRQPFRDEVQPIARMHRQPLD